KIDLSSLSDARNSIVYSALRKLIPKSSFASDTAWDHLYLLLYKGKPIGLTSPVTLVSTASDCSYVPIDVPWYNGKRLTSPFSTADGIRELADHEASLLARWLMDLKGRLQNHSQTKETKVNSHLLDRLTRQLDQFISDLPQPASYNASAKDLGMVGTGSGIFAYLNTGVARPPGTGKSDVAIVPSRGRVPTNSLLVIDPTISSQW